MENKLSRLKEIASTYENMYTKNYDKYYERIQKNINAYTKKFPELFSEEFENYCIENIFPLINEMEERKSTKMNGKVYYYSILGLLFFILFSFYNPILGYILAMAYGIAVSFFILKSQKPTHNNLRENQKNDINYKEKILPILFSFYKNCEYVSLENDKYQFKTNLDSLMLFKGINFEIEDYFKIKYSDTDIEMCEINFFAGNPTPEFLGPIDLGLAVFFRIKASSDFVSRTVVIQKEGILAREIKGMDIVKLEDNEFNELFDVYSTDHIDARRLMSLTQIERLRENYSEKKQIGLSYENGYVNIFFNAGKKYAFEIGCLDKKLGIENIKYLRYMIIDLIEYLSVIDALKLGTLV